MKFTFKHGLEILGRVPFYLLGVLGGSMGLSIIYFQFDINKINSEPLYGRTKIYMTFFKMIGTGLGSWGVGIFFILLGYTISYIILTNTYEHVEYFYTNEYRYNKRVMFFNISVYTLLCIFLSLKVSIFFN